MKKSTIIIIVVIALLAIWGVTGYNGLVTMDENVSGQCRTSKHNINVVPT